MTKEELIEELEILIENGADLIEVFEYIEDNSDFDPAEIIEFVKWKENKNGRKIISS